MEKTTEQKFLDVLIDIEGCLLENKPEECLNYVLQVKKEIIADIKKKPLSPNKSVSRS